MSTQVPFEACGGGGSPSSPTTEASKRMPMQGLISMRLQQLSSTNLLSTPTSKERRLSLIQLEAQKRSRLIRKWEKMSQQIELAQKKEQLERSRRQAISRQQSELPPTRPRPLRRPSVSSDCLHTIRPLADNELDHEASAGGDQLGAEPNDDGVDRATAAAFRRLTKSGLISPRTRPQQPAWAAVQSCEEQPTSRRGSLRASSPEVGGGSVAGREQEAAEGKNWLVSACGRLPRAMLVKIGGRHSATPHTQKPVAVGEPHTSDAEHDAASHTNTSSNCLYKHNYDDKQQRPEAQERRLVISEVETFLRQRRDSTVPASGLAMPRLTITVSPDDRPPAPGRPRSQRRPAAQAANNNSRGGADNDDEEDGEGEVDLENERNATSLIDDEEYSSEEEKEDRDGVKVVVKCRSKTINRDDLEDPVKKQGWLMKLGDGRFAQWKKRWVVLEYPFLLWGTGEGKVPKYRLSMRGGCMVDPATYGVKSVKRPDCTFRVSGGKRMFLFEAASPEDKQEWIAALWTNVFYANPAKRHCGVAYTVELQMGVGKEPKLCIFVVDLRRIRMFDATTKEELWQRPVQHIQSITRPQEDKDRWVIFDFGDNGGWVVMGLQPTTTPTAIFNSVQSILLTHLVWKGNPILFGNC